MSKQKIKKLKWLLDFMYLDAERLSTGERAKIYTELDEIAFDTQKFFWTEAAIEELQKRGKKIDKSSAASLITPYEDLPQDQLIEDLQKLQEKFKKLLRNFLDNKKQDFEPINISFTLFPNIKLSSKDEVTRVITWCNGETEDIVAFHFIRSLDGIKRDIFYSCPECDNWFIHTSKREKIFCSNKCAARKVSRERRAKLKANDKKDGKYSAILKKGAERARKSYEKKVPQGKPARRPYKYKTKGE